MTTTATRTSTTTSVDIRREGGSTWKHIQLPSAGNSEYARIAELHSGDLAKLPIMLTDDQAKSLEDMHSKNPRPRVLRLLPVRD